MKSKIACMAALAFVAAFAVFAIDKAKAYPPEGFTTDYAAALERAKESGKQVFILFTGSDWCPYCIKLEKEVVSKSEFREWAKDRFELVFCDFPMKDGGKNVTAEQKAANMELSKSFGIQGYPTIIIAGADGKATGAVLGYQKGGVKKWMEYAQREIETAPLAKKHLGAFESEIEALEAADKTFFKVRAQIEGMKDKDSAEKEKIWKPAFAPWVAKIDDVAGRLAKAEIPPELEPKRKELREQLDFLRAVFSNEP